MCSHNVPKYVSHRQETTINSAMPASIAPPAPPSTTEETNATNATDIPADGRRNPYRRCRGVPMLTKEERDAYLAMPDSSSDEEYSDVEGSDEDDSTDQGGSDED